MVQTLREILQDFPQSLQISLFHKGLFGQKRFLMEPVVLQRTHDEPLLQNRVLQEQMVLGKISTLQKGSFGSPYL